MNSCCALRSALSLLLLTAAACSNSSGTSSEPDGTDDATALDQKALPDWQSLDLTDMRMPGDGVDAHMEDQFDDATVDVAEPDDTALPDLPVDVPAPVCGDATCNGGETCQTCEQDCGACPPECGDASCNGLESCVTCVADCGECPPGCGDGTCNGSETCQVCPQDCGACPPECGDLVCNGTETCESCLKDCGACPPKCGDATCQDTESCATCEKDCGLCPVPCGDGECDASQGETCSTCLADCGPCPYCGDGTCGNDESCQTCPFDCECPVACGDEVCNGDETCDNCPGDCGTCIVCGDGTCHDSETCSSCWTDCGQCAPVCGDLVCKEGETCSSCAVDCGVCPAQCGNGTCNGDETCVNCEQDCGVCPPLLTFTSWWEENLSGGPIVQGGKLRLLFSLDRLAQCRSTHNGYPGWTISLYYTFDLSQQAKELPMVMHNSFAGTSVAWEQTIDVPSDAENLFMWVRNSDVTGCEAWDSNLDKNYIFPVFAASTIAKAIDWAGNFQFIFYTEAGPQFKGDVDPAYYFSNFAGSEVATWVQFEVYVSGITDRTYQDNFVMKQVAANAIKAWVNTDAYYPDGLPGATMKDGPMDVLNPAGNNFVYRWFPPMYIGWGSYIPPGAYSYFLKVATWLSENAFVIGKTGANQAPRTMVLGDLVNCALFPFNPPTTYCP